MSERGGWSARGERSRPGGDRLGRANFAVVAAIALAVLAACGPGEGRSGDAMTGDAEAGGARGATQPVLPGIDVLFRDSLHLVAGKRVGLVTNHTAIDAEGRHAIDLLHEHPEVTLVALYSPEHGIRGDAEAGVRVASGIDEETGLPVHSLYGETRRPTPETLEGVDVLLFDIQDIGTRYYTYVYTMALSMEAAGEVGIPFVVLDRPNPIGGELVQGNILDPAYSTFVGMYPTPMRHGMTPGELARLFRDAFGVEADLHVVPLDGWRRDMLFSDTGLPWRAPSPNMPDQESALHYPGTCLFEGTNLSVGRGTDRAFQQIGAPWLDGDALADAMAAHGLPGVRFDAIRFTPVNAGDGKFSDEEVSGVRLIVTDPTSYDPARTGIALAVEARRLAGDEWQWFVSHFDRLAGTDAIRLGIDAGADPDELVASWDAELRGFLPARAAALLY